MTTVTNKHTPVPWCVVPGTSAIHTEDGLYLGGANLRQGENEANAAFIVRACNSHYELLEALEALSEMLYAAPNWMLQRYRLPISKARAAIAKARGDL